MHDFSLARDAFLEDKLQRAAFVLQAEGGFDADLAARLPAAIGSDPAFITAKAACDDTSSQAALAAAGFYPADVNLVFEGPVLPLADSGATVRPAQPKDREAVRELARYGFPCSRFHRDHNIPSAAADEVKAAWADNFFLGKRGDALLVAESMGAIAGFMLLLIRDALVVDLITVDKTSRGQGLGSALLAGAAEVCGSCSIIRAGTQAANVRSVRFYEKNGFRLTDSSIVMHYWTN